MYSRFYTRLISVLLASALYFQANGQVNLLSQGFEALPFPPTGWSNVRMTGPTLPGTWSRITNGLYPVQTPKTGSYQMRYNSHNYLTGTSGEMRTAVLNFSTAGIYTVSFWMYRDNWVAADKLEVFVNTTQTSVGGTLLGTINRDRAQSPAVATNGWYQYTFTIPGAFNTTTNYIIFKATSAFGNDIYVDDISVDRLAAAAPGCVTTISPATGTTGTCINQTMSWGIVPLASGYKITIGSNAPNYDNVANNLDLGVALNYTTFLNPSTTYFWKVTPYNIYGDAAGCSFNSFTTGTSTCYCIPVYLDGSCGSEDYIDDFSTTGGATNISNNNSGCTTNPNNYTFFSAQTVTAQQGNSFNVSMQCGPDFAEGFAIWVDWNGDGDFADAGEYAFNSGVATLAVVNGSVTVPYTAVPGTTRMRIRCSYNYVPEASTFCTTFNEGETEDYNITITPCPAVTYYADTDADTYGNAASPINSCTGAPTGYVLNNTDCNDASNAAYPGAAEICDGIDNDCDGLTDEGLTFLNYYTDADADGFGSNTATAQNSCAPVPGKVTNNTDCNDANDAVKPGATEICNAIDDDCDGATDEGLTFLDYYTDADTDGWGSNTAAAQNSCAPVPGKVTNNLDCNDANAAVRPGAVEVCNAIDDDCDASTDEGLTFVNYYIDADGDGYGSNTASPVSNCAPIAGYVTNNLDCNDAVTAIKPGAVETCNSIDDDCDASIDEGVITATITAGGPTTFCKGTNLILSANTGVGYTYQWLRNGANIAGATASTYSVGKSGNYTCRVTIPGGCFNVSTAISVTVLASPSATITAPAGTDLCGVASVELRGTNGTGFSWQWIKNGANIDGATDRIYFATTTGSYRVKVVNPSGCSKTSGVTSVVKTCREGDEMDTPALAMYPNPAVQTVMVTLNGLSMDNAAQAHYQLLDATGKIVAEGNWSLNLGATSNELNISGLPSGMYVLHISDGTNQLHDQLMIAK